jgi:hypothetical protein
MIGLHRLQTYPPSSAGPDESVYSAVYPLCLYHRLQMSEEFMLGQ